MYVKVSTFCTLYCHVNFSGSIIVSFTVGGPSADIDTTLDSIWLILQAGYTLSFEGNSLVAHNVLTVDGDTYYGSQVIK